MKKKAILAKRMLQRGLVGYQVESEVPLVIVKDGDSGLALLRGAAALKVLPDFRLSTDLEPLDITPDEERMVGDYLMSHYLNLVTELGIVV